MKLSDYAALGGHMDYVRPLNEVKGSGDIRQLPWQNPIPGRRA
jgi:6-hydroxynicotinate reductase